MTAAATFCCLDCRLVQPPAEQCRECASPSVAALAFESEILAKPIKRQRGKVANVVTKTAAGVGAVSWYAAVVAGGVLVSPVIPAVALGTFLAGAFVLAARKRKKRITTVPLLAPRTGDGAVTRRGIARKLAETIVSSDGGEPVLVEEATLRGKADSVYFRRTRGTRFLVDVDGGERVVVDGILRVTSAKLARSPATVGADLRLAALGIEGVQVAGTLELAVIRDGDPVEVTGLTTTEAVPELAFDRDAGQATLMLGRARSVVLVRHT